MKQDVDLLGRVDSLRDHTVRDETLDGSSYWNHVTAFFAVLFL